MDAIIVGAGVVGASTALELTRAGYSVTVVDKAGGPGFGSTSASSAVDPESTTPAYWSLCSSSAA